MPTPWRVEQMDLGGGLMTGVPATHIEANQAAELHNLISYGPRLSRRPALKKKTGAYAGGGLTSLFRYRATAYDEVELIASTRTNLLRWSGGSWYALGSAVSDSIDPWSMTQLKKTLYAARRGVGLLRSEVPGPLGPAGIDEPATAPTLAQSAGAGALEAGDYKVVVRFANSRTGNVGNPSAEATVTLAASKAIDYSAIPVSGNVQVDTVELFRTLKGQSGVYYKVGSVTNGTTTFSEDQTTDEMGDPVSFRNGMPPAGVFLVEKYKERLWLSDGASLFPSEVLTEGFSSGYDLPVGPDDGYEVTALLETPARLVVGKENSLWYVAGDSPANFTIEPLSPRHGVASPLALIWAEGRLFWFGDDEVWMMQDGADPVAIGRPWIAAFLDQLNPEMRHAIQLSVYAPLGWLLLSIPYEAVPADGHATYDHNTRTMVYDYRDQRWIGELEWEIEDQGGPGSVLSQAPAFCASVVDPQGGPELLAVFPENSYVWDLLAGGEAEADEGQQGTISWSYQGKKFGGDAAKHGLHRVSLLGIGGHPGTVVTLYALTDSGVSVTRGLTTDDTPGWVTMSLSTLRDASTTLQLKITGSSAFDLDGIILTGFSWQRTGRVR